MKSTINTQFQAKKKYNVNFQMKSTIYFFLVT